MRSERPKNDEAASLELRLEANMGALAGTGVEYVHLEQHPGDGEQKGDGHLVASG